MGGYAEGRVGKYQKDDGQLHDSGDGERAKLD